MLPFDPVQVRVALGHSSARVIKETGPPARGTSDGPGEYGCGHVAKSANQPLRHAARGSMRASHVMPPSGEWPSFFGF